MMSIGEYASRALSRSAISDLASSLDDRLLQAFLDGVAEHSRGFCLGFLVGVVLDELLERIALLVLGEQQPASQFTPCLVDRRERNDLGRVQDGRIEAKLECRNAETRCSRLAGNKD